MRLAAIDKLWFAGAIDGPAMAQALCDWIALLRSLGLDPVGDPDYQALLAAAAAVDVNGRDLLECDPKIAAFLELLRKAVENCGKTAGAKT